MQQDSQFLLPGQVSTSAMLSDWKCSLGALGSTELLSEGVTASKRTERNHICNKTGFLALVQITHTTRVARIAVHGEGT